MSHELDAIGWASLYEAEDRVPAALRTWWRSCSSAALAITFSLRLPSEICDLIQRLVEQNPEALDRRMSRFEQGQTPLCTSPSTGNGTTFSIC